MQAVTYVLMVVGLSIAQPDPDSKYGQSLAPMLPTGTKICLAVSDKTKTFLEISDEETKIETLTDDKGTDMMESPKKGSFLQKARLDAFPKISEDKHAIAFAISSPVVPAKGAKELQLKASIVLVAGEDLTSQEQKDVSLKDDTEITIGPAPLTITSVKEKSFSVKTEKPIAAIKQILFMDAEGKTLDIKQGSRSVSGWKTKTYTLYFYAEAKMPEAVTVKIEYYKKTEKITVPVDVKFGVGL